MFTFTEQKQMIPIKLMADLQCHPLWNTSAESSGNIDPKTLPISQELQIGLRQWADNFESATNQGQTGFLSAKDKANFERQGTSLKNALQTELGEGYKVNFNV